MGLAGGRWRATGGRRRNENNVFGGTSSRNSWVERALRSLCKMDRYELGSGGARAGRFSTVITGGSGRGSGPHAGGGNWGQNSSRLRWAASGNYLHLRGRLGAAKIAGRVLTAV